MEVVCFRLPGHGDSALKNMNSLRTRQHFCDITIVASGKQTFRGHKVVLAACSPFLRDQFLLNPSPELQVSGLHSSTVVCELLQSCYTGLLQFSSKEIVNYLTAASYLQMEHVVEKCRGALSQYLQPRNPSSLETVKTEDSHAMPVIVSGSAYSLHSMSPPADQSPSLQPHCPGEESHPAGDNHTDVQHRDTDDVSERRVRASDPSGSFQTEERNDYEVYQVCVGDDDQNQEEKHNIAGEEEAVVVLDDHCQETDTGEQGQGIDQGSSSMDAAQRHGAEREGLRTWRRRLVEPRGGRGRGFKYRKRGLLRERRQLNMGYQEAWRFPTAGEMMGNFGVDFGAGYLSGQSHTDSSLQEEGRPGESQGEGEPVPEEAQAHFSLDASSGEDGVRMMAVPAGEEEGGGDDSVAVVGSTSCATGSVACEHCGLAFSSAQALALHSRATHLLYVCPCCGKHFSHASNLNRHMSVHRGAKAHRCPLCHKTFTQKSTLCDHMNLHSGERPHRCSYCHVRFAHKPALRRHLKEQHGKTTAQNCLEALKESEASAGGGGL
ncbi:zinc finger and BTB domain-containing protein 12-like [Chanos chanos]|uniref:Zinc finger and BTB domain-containing protein 12-like n=1 Tax=Chanos chanos TaxID=29144 RepID=A0A6J2WL76_CHACN|nr:zinc finger and BTB domain-containing protein 12-like [Chanos chanos]